MTNKLKMFLVIYPTYGDHKNKLNGWWQSGDLNYVVFVFYFTATILLLFVQLTRQVGQKRVGWWGEELVGQEEGQ